MCILRTLCSEFTPCIVQDRLPIVNQITHVQAFLHILPSITHMLWKCTSIIGLLLWSKILVPVLLLPDLGNSLSQLAQTGRLPLPDTLFFCVYQSQIVIHDCTCKEIQLFSLNMCTDIIINSLNTYPNHIMLSGKYEYTESLASYME